MQIEPNTRTHYGFEKQFSEHYTKAVFTEFRRKLKNRTLFRIKTSQDPTVDKHNYLVTYHEPTDMLSWSNHEFKVVANTETEEYSCECMLFEHTGKYRQRTQIIFTRPIPKYTKSEFTIYGYFMMKTNCFFMHKNYLLLGLFYVHMIAMLEHLRVKSVPDIYILKRYTTRAKARETFDRRDYKTESFDGSSFLHQQNELLQIALKIVRIGGKSDDQHVTAKAGLLEVLNRVEAVGSSTTADDDDGDACTPPDINQFEPDLSTEMPRTSHDDVDMPSTGCNA